MWLVVGEVLTDDLILLSRYLSIENDINSENGIYFIPVRSSNPDPPIVRTWYFTVSRVPGGWHVMSLSPDFHCVRYCEGSECGMWKHHLRLSMLQDG